MKFLILSLILGLSFFYKAQEKTRMLLSLDNRKSIFSPTSVNTLGLRVGYKYGCLVNVGFGVYAAQNIEFDKRLDPLDYPNASTSLSGKLTYLTLFVEPIILSEKNKIFSIPIGIGGGNLKVKYRELNSVKKHVYFNGFLPVVDVSGVFMVKLVPFIWIGGGVGYRHFIHEKDFVNESINSPYYLIKLKIGRPCKETSSFYKWRKNLFDKKDKKDKNGWFK